jgi:hypothetical protein
VSLLLLFQSAAEEVNDAQPRVTLGGVHRRVENGFITIGSSLLLATLAATAAFRNDTSSYIERRPDNTVLMAERGVNPAAPVDVKPFANPPINTIRAPRANTILLPGRGVNAQAPVAPADALPSGGRAPTLQVQRKLNLNDTTVRNLNTGTLGFQSIASAMCEWPRNVEPKRLLSDTSAGMPEALRTLVAAPPFFSTPFSSVQLPRFTPAEVRSGLNASLSPNATRVIGQASFPPNVEPRRLVRADQQSGLSASLSPNATLVVGQESFPQNVEPNRLLSETSAGMPEPLRTASAVVLPFINQFGSVPEPKRGNPVSQGQGLNTSLSPNATRVIGQASFPQNVEPKRLAKADQQSGLNASLSPNATRAIGQATPHLLVEPRRALTDTSQSPSRLLLDIAQAVVLPFRSNAALSVSTLRNLVATEQGTPRLLLDVQSVVLPFRVEAVQQPRRIALLSETSYGTPKALFADVSVLPTLQNQFTSAPQYWQVYFDSDLGLPNTLRANAEPLPIGLNAPFYSVQRRVIPNDTTVTGLNNWTLAAQSTVSMSFYHPLDTAGVLTGGASVALNSCLTLSSGFPGTGDYPVVGQGIIRTGALGGTAKLQFRAEVAGVITAKEGMTLIVEKVA